MTREEWRDRAVEHGVEIAKLKKQLKACLPALARFFTFNDGEENARILLMNKINEVLK